MCGPIVVEMQYLLSFDRRMRNNEHGSYQSRKFSCDAIAHGRVSRLGIADGLIRCAGHT